MHIQSSHESIQITETLKQNIPLSYQEKQLMKETKPDNNEDKLI